jgi:hypothetical protein
MDKEKKTGMLNKAGVFGAAAVCAVVVAVLVHRRPAVSSRRGGDESRRRTVRRPAPALATRSTTTVVVVGRSARGLARRAQALLATANAPHSVVVHCVCVQSDAPTDFRDTVESAQDAFASFRTQTRWRLVHDAAPSTSLVRCRKRWAVAHGRDDATSENDNGRVVVFAHACEPACGWDALCWSCLFPRGSARRRRTRKLLVAWPHEVETAHFPVVLVDDGVSRVKLHPFVVTGASPRVWRSSLVSHDWIAMDGRDVVRFPFVEGLLGQTAACLRAKWTPLVSDSLVCAPASTLKVKGAPRTVRVATSLGTRAADRVGLSADNEGDVDAAEVIAKYGSVDEGMLRMAQARHDLGLEEDDDQDRPDPEKDDW